MPLNPKAAYITEPSRAAQLFPAGPCRTCSGSTKVQRYRKETCEICQGSGKGEYKPEGQPPEQPGHCSACYSDFHKKSSGQRQFAESIPCTECNGQGTKRRVNDARPQTLAAMKPGDWVVIGVEFPALPIEDASPEYKAASAELISCMVIRCAPSATTLITARVIHAPEYTSGHGLRYGDLLQIGPNNVLVHSQCTPEEFEKAKDGGLFTFAPVLPIAPVPGREFFTRGGERATIWTTRTEGGGQFAIGKLRSGSDCEWNMDGTDRQGRRDNDLVQFTEVVNA
jgi:hypothetical protein